MSVSTNTSLLSGDPEVPEMTTRATGLNDVQFYLAGITLHVNFRGMPDLCAVSAAAGATFTHYYINGVERVWSVTSRDHVPLAYSDRYFLYIAAPKKAGQPATVEFYVTEKVREAGAEYLEDDVMWYFPVGTLTASRVGTSEDLKPRVLESAYFGKESITADKLIGRMQSASGNSFIDWDNDSFQFGNPDSPFYFQWNVKKGVAELKGIFILDSHGNRVDIGSFLSGNITEDFLNAIAQNINLADYFNLTLDGMQIARGGIALGGGLEIRSADNSAQGYTIAAAIDRQGNARVKSLEVGEFVDGIAGGNGAQITAEGRMKARSLELTESLTVPELIYNRAEVILGVQWGAPGGGKIKSVDAENQIVELKLEEGEIGGVKVDDICMGIWHFQNGDLNASVDEDDSRMNFRFAGFATIYFRVTEVLDGNNSRFRYALRAVDEDYTRQYHPQAMMSFVGYGNFTDKSRQQSRYDTREYKRYLQGVNTWTITAANIAAQYGDLANLRVHGLEMTGYSAYLNNVYFSGVIQEIEAAPLRMEISFSLDGFMAPGERGVISVAIKKAFDDVTYLMRSWTWKRDTGDAADDAVWNMAHRDATDTLEIGYEDLGPNSMLNVSTLFTITASDLAGKSVTGQLTI